MVDRERLAGLASFDGNYLNMPQLLSHWDVKIEGASTPAETIACYVSSVHFCNEVVLKVGSPRVDQIIRGATRIALS